MSGTVDNILAKIPAHVTVVAAAKTRTLAEVKAILDAGIRVIGHNYVQEAERHVEGLSDVPSIRVEMIGHLQRNKVRHAIRLFDRIQTVDSLRLAEKIDAECEKARKTMSILVEVNSGLESQKAGVSPDAVRPLIDKICDLQHLRVEGLMTMGPLVADPEALRPVFRATRALFEDLKDLSCPNVDMQVLSMGMSNSYRVAIEEGSTMVRLGTMLFGPRPAKPV